MKLMKNGSILLIGFLFAVLALQCGDKHYIEYEKERFIYKDSLETLAEQLDHKIAQLRGRVEAVESDDELQTALKEEINDLELLQERFNQAIGRVEEVGITEWEKTKIHADNLMMEFEEEISRINQEYSLESSE